MKVHNSNARRGARRTGLGRLRAAALLCLVAAACGVLGFGFRGAGAQGKQRAGVKSSGGAATKGAPAVGVEQVPGRFKSSGPKDAGVAPLVLACPAPPATSPTITFGQTVSGTLQSGDCTNPLDGSFYDAYTFTGTAGQQAIITMNSAAVDAYVYLVRPGETTLSDATFQDDDSDKGTDSRLSVTLPSNGTYQIIANTFSPGETGAYTLTLSGGGVCNQVETPIARNSTVSGSLASSPTTSDCTLDDGSFYDVFTFTANAGEQASVTMTSTTFNTFLFLIGPDGDELARNDDVTTGNTNSRVPVGTGLARLPSTGTYRIVANALNPGDTGSYTVTLTISGNCAPTPINIGQTVGGAGTNIGLSTTDCRLPFDGSFIDVYSFNATAGQSINISLNSAAFDTYLFLLGPSFAGSTLYDFSILAENDDSAAGTTNSRIPPSSGSITLSRTGTYVIYVNSYIAGRTGDYTLTLNGTQPCTVTLTSPSRAVDAGDSVNISDAFTTQSGCAEPAVASNVPWITGVSASVNGTAGTFTYTVAANTTTVARAGTITVGGQTFTVNQAAAIACVTGVYPTVQPFTAAGGAGRFTVFSQSGCSWQATSNASWITVTVGAPGATNPNNRVRFNVAANNTGATRTGTITVGTQTFTVTQTSAGTTPAVQFAFASNPANEGDPSRSVTVAVTRTGDTAGAVTVQYATVDDPAAVPCDPTLRQSDGSPYPSGTAFARCDYATTIDTLTFLPGETSKSFTIPLITDVHVEGTETFQIALSNPQGATLGAQQTAAVSITDDDTSLSATNPINTTPVFVRMQYLDFLNREPEQGEPWSAVINGCPNPFNQSQSTSDPSSTCDRISVSTNFVGSQEFQLKGFFVFLYHKVSFGSAANPNYVATYDDFVADSRRVTGSSANEVFAKRNDLAEDWVNRPAFKARYDSMTNEQFVDTLLANVGATLTSADPNSGATRDSLVANLNAGTRTRAEVLRVIVQSSEVLSRQRNHAFVAMQYYGYLRRTPEPGGYQAWLDTINNPANGTRGMVGGFLYSGEYRRRFGPNTNN
jgi:hypothetical protein